MQKISRDKIKKKGFLRFLRSFKYSIDGLYYSYKEEQSLYIHLIGTILAIILGIVLKINLLEWAILGFGFGFLLSIELINTAIEAAVDLVTLEINPLAKIAKDCGSAASFVSTIIVLIGSIAIYAPYIMNLVK